MDKQQNAATIRESWIRWLTNANDEQILAFHQQAREFIADDQDRQTARTASDGINRQGFSIYQPKHRDSYYATVNNWLRARGYQDEPTQVIDTMQLADDVRQRAERADHAEVERDERGEQGSRADV
jgi:hypothetical protein